MSGRLNWRKATMERKIREQGSSPLEDLLPRAPDGVRLSPKGNVILKKDTRPKRKKKAPQTKTRRPARLRYLEAVVMALVRGQPQPKPFKKMSPAERADIERYPSRLDWARKQPEFSTIEQRERQRFAAKLNENKEKPDSAATRAEPSGKDAAKRISFLRSEISAAQQFIKAAEKELKKLLDSSNRDNG